MPPRYLFRETLVCFSYASAAFAAAASIIYATPLLFFSCRYFADIFFFFTPRFRSAFHISRLARAAALTFRAAMIAIISVIADADAATPVIFYDAFSLFSPYAC